MLFRLVLFGLVSSHLVPSGCVLFHFVSASFLFHFRFVPLSFLILPFHPFSFRLPSLRFVPFPLLSFPFLSVHCHAGGGYCFQDLVDEATSETPDSVDMKKVMSSPALQQMLSPLPAPPAVSAMGTPIGGLDGVGVGGGHPTTPAVTAG